MNAVAPPELRPSAFIAICEIYPPSHKFAWWNAADANATKHAEVHIGGFTSAMWRFVEWASDAYNFRAMVDVTAEAAAATSPQTQTDSSPFYSPAVYRGRSIFEEESGLIHKMLIHWIYFVRHFPSACKTQEQRLYEDISHQHYGHKHTQARARRIWFWRSLAYQTPLFPLACVIYLSWCSGRLALSWVTRSTSAPHSVLYFRHTNGYFVPMHQRNSHDGCEWHVSMCAYAPCEGRQRVMVLHNQKISDDDGLMVHNTATRTVKMESAAANSHSNTVVPRQQQLAPTGGEIYGFIGPHGQHPFTSSPFRYKYASTALRLEHMEDMKWPQPVREELEASIMEAAKNEPRFNLLSTMQSLLQDSFPGPQQRVGITVPHCPSEKQSVELLLLETLAEYIDSTAGANVEVQDWMRQIEEEAGTSFNEVLQDARYAEMQLYIQEQNAQHAAVVAAHEIRAASGSAPAGQAITQLTATKSADNAAVSTSPTSSSVLLESAVTSCTLSEHALAWKKARRVKYRHVEGLFRRVLKALSKSSAAATITVSGSHHTLHSRHSHALTLVRVHSKKDASMGGRYATRLAERLMQVTARVGLQC